MEQGKEDLVKKKLDAIASIVEVLNGFEQHSDVMDIVNFALKHVGAVTSEVQRPEYQSNNGSLANSEDTISAFVHKKNPKNEYQRIAVIAYFLMKQQGMTSLKAQDIVTGNTDARQPRFSNISSSINRTVTRYKYLVPAAARGEYRLSVSAEDMVNALPDQMAAKAVISSTRRTRKVKRSRKDAVASNE